MQVYYNSYDNDTKAWLQHYIEWATFIGNQEIILEELKTELTLEPSPKGTHYGFDMGGGGWDKPSQEQVALEAKEAKEYRYNVLSAKVKKLNARIKVIDNSLASLSSTEAQVLKGRFINEQKWAVVAMNAGYNEKTCRSICYKALHKVAIMIWGEEARNTPTGLNFFPITNKSSI